MEGLQCAAGAVRKFGDQTVARGQALQETARRNTTAFRGQTMATVGMGLALFGLMKPSIDLQAQTSEVAAVTGANDEQQQALRKTVRQLGRDTKFSALEAAESMKALGMAGFDTERIIAAMPNVLSLAAAGGANLGETAAYSSNMLDAFGLAAEDMGRVGDVLVNTFTSSDTDLHKLAAAMSYAAPVGRSTGLEVKAVAGMLGKPGDAGISGERAGTALRAMMTRLSSPSTEARRALDDLNVSVTDAEGNMRPLPELLAEMQINMEGMGNAARSEMRSAVFGMEVAGTGAFQAYIESLRETGSAARVAEAMSDNACGALERPDSIWFDMRVALGGGLLPVLLAVVDQVIPIIGAAGEWFEVNQELVTSLGWVVAGLLAMNITLLAAKWGFRFLFGWVGSVVVDFGRMFQAISFVGRAFAFLTLWAGPALKIALLALGNALIFLGRMGVLALWGLRAVGAALLWLAGSVARAGLMLLKIPLFPAIAAIGAAVYLIYQNWDNIVGCFTEKFDRVKDAFQTGFLTGLAQLVAGFNIFTLFIDMIEAVLRYLGNAFDIDLFTQGANMIESLRAGIYSVLTSMAAPVRNYLAGIVPDWLVRAWNHVSGGGGESAAPERDTRSRRSGRDSGGVVRPVLIYKINESAQEYFAPSLPGSVIKGSDLSGRNNGYGSPGGDTFNIVINGVKDAVDIEARLTEFLRRRDRNKRYALHDGALA